MTCLPVAIATFFLGLIIGVVGLVRWLVYKMNDPEFARRCLQFIYETSHPHWLQVSKDDKKKVCPCCGWTEKEKS